MFFCSVRTRGNFSPARNVLSTTEPLVSDFSFVRTNAPPLPGFTCWNSTIRHVCPSSSMCIPLRNWFVETTSAIGAGGYPTNLIPRSRTRKSSQQDVLAGLDLNLVRCVNQVHEFELLTSCRVNSRSWFKERTRDRLSFRDDFQVRAFAPGDRSGCNLARRESVCVSRLRSAASGTTSAAR